MNVIYLKRFNKNIAKYSIVTPVYNQQNIIVRNIKSYITNTLNYFEIIVIIDCCSDDTKKTLLAFFREYENVNDNFVQITLIETEEPFFETMCDNVGFRRAEGEYVLEIQADMMMTEMGYNISLTKPFTVLNNVIAVSGRCAHNLFRKGGVGKIGIQVEKNISELDVNRNIFYVYETCNRGPLLIDRKKLIELDYLDENNYFLDGSDHDLMARAYINHGYICGYVPINFYSPLRDGSTRKMADPKNRQKKIYFERLMGDSKNKIERYKKKWIDLPPKMYYI